MPGVMFDDVVACTADDEALAEQLCEAVKAKDIEDKYTMECSDGTTANIELYILSIVCWWPAKFSQSTNKLPNR